MKRLPIYATVFILIFFCSCQKSKIKENKEDTIKRSVANAEKIISKLDNNIQSAIDSKSFRYITIVASESQDSLGTILQNLQNLEVPENLILLKKTAAEYIQSLDDIILAEQNYSYLNDSTSAEKAQYIDNKLLQATTNSKRKFSEYKKITGNSAKSNK